jgi:probable rRNA maturation factor
VIVLVDHEVEGITEGWVEAELARALVAAGLTEAEVSVVLTDDERIRAINLAWRGKDAATDVLSFPQDDPLVLGDIVVSLDTARRAAEELGHDVLVEVRVLLVHGLCHLLGYDHETDEEAAEMRALEARLLDGVGLVARAWDA